MNIVLDLGFE